MPTKVHEQSDEVAALAEAWALAAALMGGTATMREAGDEYLPQWPNEADASHNARLATATLFPAFSRTVGVMGGKPFSKQITIGDDVPPQIVEYAQDIDLEGRNLHAFAADMMAEALAFGLCGVLVEFPPKNPNVVTVADQQAVGARPYFVAIKHDNILGWKAQRVGGVIRLTQLRLAETREVDDGAFGTAIVQRVRVLTPGAWAAYEPAKNAKDDWLLVDEGVTTLSDIPFVPFYGRRAAFMLGTSPLIDLAHLNIEHWQSKSDQQTVLHVARVPILAVIGVDDDNWSLTVGASAAVKLPVGGDMKFVEHSGAAISAGQASLDKLENEMIQTGAELLVRTPGQRSATESNNEAEANKSELQRIVESFEDALDQSLQYMADWLMLPEGGHVSLFADYGAGSMSDASAQLIVALQQGGLISKDTAITEMQRRGVLSPNIDPEIELDAVSAEGPALGLVGVEE